MRLCLVSGLPSLQNVARAFGMLFGHDPNVGARERALAQNSAALFKPAHYPLAMCLTRTG
jgi:hypothetical protein